MIARPETSTSDRRATFFVWRDLRKDELDHELIWSSTSIGSVLVGAVWMWSGKAFPPCVFHTVTGYPCPTCGMTRATLKLLAGDIAAAFAFNPLYIIGLTALVIYNLYAVTVLAGRLPRLRLGTLPSGWGSFFRWGTVAVLLINWAWLVHRGI